MFYDFILISYSKNPNPHRCRFVTCKTSNQLNVHYYCITTAFKAIRSQFNVQVSFTLIVYTGAMAVFSCYTKHETFLNLV